MYSKVAAFKTQPTQHIIRAKREHSCKRVVSGDILSFSVERYSDLWLCDLGLCDSAVGLVNVSHLVSLGED